MTENSKLKTELLYIKKESSEVIDGLSSQIYDQRKPWDLSKSPRYAEVDSLLSS